MLDVRIYALGILVVLSAFFSGVESAFLSLNRVKVRRLVEKKIPKAGVIKKLKDDPHTLITTILIGNNLVNISASALATALAIDYFGSQGVGIATGIMTLVILTFGEIIPKTYSVNNREKICLLSARPIRILSIVFYPLIKVLDAVTKTVSKLFPSQEQKSRISEEELKTIITMSEEEGSIDKNEKEMINNIFRFTDLEVGDIMVPRTEIVGIEDTKTVKDALKIMLESGFSRIPVYHKNMDNITRIVHIKDILDAVYKKKLSTRVDKLGREPYFIPKQKMIDNLLEEFKSKKVHLAVVVNEYCGVEGIITIEDLLEEIVGEIYDESDKLDNVTIKKTGKNEAIVSGIAEIKDINKQLGVHLKPEYDVDTISGFIFEEIERIPKKGEILELKKVKLMIEDADAKGINKVKITWEN